MTSVVLRLSDDMTDVGDVLVWVNYHGLMSNRVRVGIGHVGGGPPDDFGAVPTPPRLVSGHVTVEGVAVSGVNVLLTGSQTATLSRWGDYSAITVDPVDDCTFWYTTEYLKTIGTFNWSTRIASFKLSTCH